MFDHYIIKNTDTFQEVELKLTVKIRYKLIKNGKKQNKSRANFLITLGKMTKEDKNEILEKYYIIFRTRDYISKINFSQEVSKKSFLASSQISF